MKELLLRTCGFASGRHHLRAVDVRPHDPLPGLVHRTREDLALSQVALRRLACLLERVDRRRLVRHDLPATELFVEELVPGITLCVPFLHGAFERPCVLRLHQGDQIVGMVEVEHRHVDLWTERGLEVTVPVEPVLPDALLGGVDRLLLVRELGGEGVDRPPLRRAGIGVDRDEHGRRRGHQVRRSRAGVGRPAAARQDERDETD